MMVGMPCKPAIAGNGGRDFGIPRFPSIDAIRAVSSPQTNAPAPSFMVISKSKPEPKMSWPNRPYLPRLGNGFLEPNDCQRILGSDVDVAVGGADGVSAQLPTLREPHAGRPRSGIGS